MERKRVTVFYNDTDKTVSKLVGELVGDIKGTLITLKVPGRRKPTHIPLSKIVRIEEGDDR